MQYIGEDYPPPSNLCQLSTPVMDPGSTTKHPCEEIRGPAVGEKALLEVGVLDAGPTGGACREPVGGKWTPDIPPPSRQEQRISGGPSRASSARRKTASSRILRRIPINRGNAG